MVVLAMRTGVKYQLTLAVTVLEEVAGGLVLAMLMTRVYLLSIRSELETKDQELLA